MRSKAKLLSTVVLALAIGVATLLAAPGGVNAGGGPHGGYGATGGIDGGLPDQCAGCHRAHTALSVSKLLVSADPLTFCATCHDGTGSKLDVMDGVRVGVLEVAGSTDVIAADNASITGVSVGVVPVVKTEAAAGATPQYSVAVRNASGGSVTITVAPGTEAPAAGNTGTRSGAIVVTPAAATVIADGASQVFTVDVPTTGLLAGDVVTLPIEATDLTPTTATVQVQVVVASAAQANNTLNGGGFTFVNGEGITSTHSTDGTQDEPWGYTGANTGTAGIVASAGALQCTTCHNPHGNDNYRMLNSSINGNTVLVKAVVGGAVQTDEGDARGLESGAPADKYIDEYYGSAGTGGAPNTGTGSIASFCGACHVAYPSTGGGVLAATRTDGTVTSFDNADHYAHATEKAWDGSAQEGQNPETTDFGALATTDPQYNFPNLRLASTTGTADSIVTCLTCHFAHGTSSTMAGWAVKSDLTGSDGNAGLSIATVSPAQTGGSLSTLLYTDNRGMCQACHAW
jgi:predicted CXXCH cytochrome family protein